IPNLLGEGRRSVLSDIEFQLKIHDQPKCARSCGRGEKGRRTIDPAPIVELVIESTRLSESEVEKYLSQSYVMSCSILDDIGEIDVSRMAESESNRPDLLMGSVVATSSLAEDEDGDKGCFFVFDDLSCRMTGSYRLMFKVVMVGSEREVGLPGWEKRRPFLATVESELFTVCNAKEFPGVSEPSALALSLRAQGCF
ncbi:velvet factor, partial [Stachybotrys elegans]